MVDHWRAKGEVMKGPDKRAKMDMAFSHNVQY